MQPINQPSYAQDDLTIDFNNLNDTLPDFTAQKIENPGDRIGYTILVSFIIQLKFKNKFIRKSTQVFNCLIFINIFSLTCLCTIAFLLSMDPILGSICIHNIL